MTSQYWNQLLDDLKVKDGFRSDAKMAASLGVSRALISAVRQGKSNFSLAVGKEIFARLGRIMTASDFENFGSRRIQEARMAVKRLSQRSRMVVINRAKLRCQLCGCMAPFIAPNGTPYFEIHLVKSIEDGGTHHPDNLVALCPNCHKRVHVLCDPADLKKLEQLDYSI